MTSTDAADARPLPTWIYLILLLPFGISSGYVTVTLAYLLPHQGMSTTALGALMAISVWPQTWKVLWAPIVDSTLTSKVWFVIGTIGIAIPMVVISAMRTPLAAIPLLTTLVVISSLSSSLTSMASETFMAHLPADQQGAASGWSQAGNVGGGAAGGGLGLYLAQHIHSQWVSGAVLALICAASCLPLIWMTAPPRTHVRPTIQATFVEVIMDVWSVIRRRPGLLVIFLMLLPLGSGGASGFWGAIADKWKVNADTVALVNGAVGGVFMAMGSLGAGYICDRMNRWSAYCLFGALSAVVLMAMAYGPRTPAVFVASTLIYGLLLGASYAAYSAVVLEAIGKGAAATKFNLMSSISNVPIAAMASFDGWMNDKHGTNGMFLGEAALSVGAAVLFGLAVVSTRRWKPAAASPA